MKKNIFEFIKKTLATIRGEYCVVLRKTAYGLEITEGLMREEKKTLKIINKITGSNIQEFKKPLLKADHLICSLDSASATTIKDFVEVKRNQKNDEITEKEFEHLIYQGLWNFLNLNRPWIASKMNTKESDLILAHIEIVAIELDNHSVINPIGFSGETISFCFQGTLVSREIMPFLGTLRNWSEHFVVCEEGAALAHFIVGEGMDIAAFCGGDSTEIFLAGERKVFYLDEIPLGMKHLASFIMEKFSVTEDVAQELIVYYTQHGVSKHLEHFFKEQFNEFVSNLFSGIDKALVKNKKIKSEKEKRKPVVHLNFNNAVSEPHRLLNKATRGTINILEQKLNHTDFSIIPEEEKTNISIVGLFLYPYSQKTLEFSNQLLHRRAKWLIANISS